MIILSSALVQQPRAKHNQGEICNFANLVHNFNRFKWSPMSLHFVHACASAANGIRLSSLAAD
jgi:hypothetical protein